MKKIMAASGMALALAAALVLGGCTPRTDRAARTDQGSTQQGNPAQNQPAPAGPAGSAQVDTGQVDSDLGSIDSLLQGVDSDMSAAASAPEDAD